jgi:CheY-specific phosphatase CheX
MDKPAMTKAMTASISEVLEQMFFMPVDFLAPDAARSAPESDNASIIAKLGFGGEPGGTFILQVPVVTARSATSDFLGIAPLDLSDDQVTGTVLEMVNMLAGSTLSIYDRHALFDLRIPELISSQDVRVLNGEFSDRIQLWIQTPESRVTFQLIVH